MDGSVVDYSGTYEEYLRSQAITGQLMIYLNINKEM